MMKKWITASASLISSVILSCNALAASSVQVTLDGLGDWGNQSPVLEATENTLAKLTVQANKGIVDYGVYEEVYYHNDFDFKYKKLEEASGVTRGKANHEVRLEKGKKYVVKAECIYSSPPRGFIPPCKGAATLTVE